MLVVTGIYLIALLWRPYIYLEDYPDWVYQGTLLAKVLSGTADPAYILKPYPVPNMMSTLVLGVLDLIMAWQWAAKLFIVLYAAVSVHCITRFLRAAGQTDEIFSACIVIAISTFGLLFFYGNINYSFAIYSCLYSCTLFLERRFDYANVLVLSLLAFLTHAVALIFCAPLILYFIIRERKWLLALSMVPAGLLSLAYVYGRYAVWHNVEQIHLPESVRYGSPSFFVFKVNTLLKLMGFSNFQHVNWIGGYLWCVFGLALSAIMLVATAVLIYQRWRAASVPEPERALWIYLFGFALLYLLSPQHALGVADLGQRLVSVVVPPVILLCWRRSWSGWIVAGGAGIFALWTIYVMGVLPPSSPGAYVSAAGQIEHIRRFARVGPWEREAFYPMMEEGKAIYQLFPSGMFMVTGQSGPP